MGTMGTDRWLSFAFLLVRMACYDLDRFDDLRCEGFGDGLEDLGEWIPPEGKDLDPLRPADVLVDDYKGDGFDASSCTAPFSAGLIHMGSTGPEAETVPA